MSRWHPYATLISLLQTAGLGGGGDGGAGGLKIRLKIAFHVLYIHLSV